jgi:hypothetical protein
MKRLLLGAVSMILAIGLTGCGNTSMVKDGILDIDKSITIGEAFDRYEYLEDITWDSFEATNGRDIVEVRGNFSKELIAEKNKLLRSKLKKGSLLTQFQINKDETFELFTINIELTGKNGKVMNIGEGVSFDNLNQLLSEIYQNKLLNF